MMVMMKYIYDMVIIFNTHNQKHSLCTSGWNGWHDFGRLRSFWNFSLSHFRDSLCAQRSRLIFIQILMLILHILNKQIFLVYERI